MNQYRWVLAVILLSALLFSFYTYTAGTRGAAINREAAIGKIIFQNKNCIACHQLYGLGGFMGPDLTYVCFEPGKGKEYARSFITNGTEKMPDFILSKEETGCLIAYLEYVGSTASTYNTSASLWEEERFLSNVQDK
ncbi:MAG: cytochrome c [Bacteroidia bacterium]|nr:cytochrome c [Bacteroidia bacterium]